MGVSRKSIQTGVPRPHLWPASLIAASRIEDWWQFKLTPPLAFFLGTLVLTRQPLLPRWPDMILLVAAIALCAAYVSFINDYFDRDEDARSAKPNRVAALPSALLAASMIGLPIAGAAMTASLGGKSLAVILYLGSWLAFTAYSAPPLRLKTRGLPGVLADAMGSTVLPILLATVVAVPDVLRTNPLWVAAATSFAVGWGLRGILWHQICDAASDRAGGVRTFVQRRGVRRATMITRFIALPLELGGLAAILALLGSVAAAAMLALYLAVRTGRARLWQVTPARELPLDEYYDGLLPLAMIVTSALRSPTDVLLIVPFLILFGRRGGRVIRHASILSWHLTKRGWVRVIPAISKRISR